MKKPTRKKLLSLLLAVSLLLSAAPIPPAAATEAPAAPSETVAAEQAAIHLDADCQILNYVDEEVFTAGNHVLRLPAEETLSSYAFLNADGTKTVYYMDEAVKFVDTDGTVQEKDIALTAAVGGYATTRNNISLTIPDDPSAGIRLAYGGHSVTLTPEGGTLSAPAERAENSIRYLNYYGKGTALVYTPTLSGVKEDIVLGHYTGQNTFTFLLDTGGLNLYQESGRWFLAESPQAAVRIELGDAVTYDARGRISLGTVTAEPLTAGSLYRLTLTVDEAFLTDESTTYPVSIDPPLEVKAEENSANIEDTTLYEGKPSTNTGSWQYAHCGYFNAEYGRGIILVRLSGLLADSNYQQITSSQIQSATFHIREATGASTAKINLYPFRGNSSWTESGATWSNSGQAVGDLVTSLDVGPNANAVFDITALVKMWKDGGNPASNGFVLKHDKETTQTKGFCTSEFATATRRPYAVVTYQNRISLNAGQVRVNVNGYVTLSAVTNPAGQAVTWTSSNTSVAEVDTDGEVTAKAIGTAVISAALADGSTARCTVYVTIADGVYYIRNLQNARCLTSLNSSGSSAGTFLDTYRNEASATRAFQLWKITYLSSGRYVIRPMNRLASALTVDSGGNVFVQDLSDSSSVPNAYRWSISRNSTGYVFQHTGLQSASMKPGNANNVITASWASGTEFHWSLTVAYGVFLRDITTQRVVNSATEITLELVPSANLSDLNLRTDYFGIPSTPKWRSSNQTVAEVNQYSGDISSKNGGKTVISLEVAVNSVTYTQEFTLIVIAPLSGYELIYEPELWNDVKVNSTYYVRHYTNCYAYILNNQIDPVNDDFGCNSIYTWDLGYHRQQPGEFYNSNLKNGETAILTNGYVDNPGLMATAVSKDFEKYNQLFGTNLIFQELSGINASCPEGTYKIALFINPTTHDYHWYRQNPDGTWSHKRGESSVKLLDDSSSPQVIYDPQYAAATAGYTRLGGYYAISPWNHYYTSSTVTSFDNPPTTTYSHSTTDIAPDLFDSIYVGMSFEQVVNILGYPEADIGSGIVVHRYIANNGNSATISYINDASGVMRVIQIHTGADEYE